MKLGSKIRERRLALDMTQEELAHRLNVSRSTFLNWEIDRNYPDISFILGLSEILDLSLEELLKDDIEILGKLSKGKCTL